jgi:hypothetical protein
LKEESIVDRIRGTLQASKVGQPRDGGQQLVEVKEAQEKEVPGKEGTEVQGKEVTGKKGSVMREAELKLARDRISREKSFIRETSQVCPAFYSIHC